MSGDKNGRRGESVEGKVEVTDRGWGEQEGVQGRRWLLRLRVPELAFQGLNSSSATN